MAREEGVLRLVLSGSWKVGSEIPQPESIVARICGGEPARIVFDTGPLASWDSTLPVFVSDVCSACTSKGFTVDTSGLPDGVCRLMGLASPERQRSEKPPPVPPESLTVRLGGWGLGLYEGAAAMVAFVGEVTVAMLRMLRGKAGFRRRDLVQLIQETGAQALPIVMLISVLVGMILAFIAAIQLQLFGAQIYVANVVGIGIVRVMGAVMAGVIMAGRTGAAFAAQIGTMQVNEEVDALETLGFSPYEFLVLPRVLALTLMMPLLTVYADLLGIIGGMIVGVGMLDIGAMEYLNQTRGSLNVTHFLIGLFHGFVFGILIALSGCLRGMQCERNASAVGGAATSAVVSAIVSMVFATMVITFSCQVLKI